MIVETADQSHCDFFLRLNFDNTPLNNNKVKLYKIVKKSFFDD